MGAKTLENSIQIYEGGVSESGSVKISISGGGKPGFDDFQIKMFVLLCKHPLVRR